MNVTASNIGGLVHLTENAKPELKAAKARELLEALDTVKGIPLGFKEAYRQRLERILELACA